MDGWAQPLVRAHRKIIAQENYSLLKRRLRNEEYPPGGIGWIPRPRFTINKLLEVRCLRECVEARTILCIRVVSRPTGSVHSIHRLLS